MPLGYACKAIPYPTACFGLLSTSETVWRRAALSPGFVLLNLRFCKLVPSRGPRTKFFLRRRLASKSDITMCSRSISPALGMASRTVCADPRVFQSDFAWLRQCDLRSELPYTDPRHSSPLPLATRLRIGMYARLLMCCLPDHLFYAENVLSQSTYQVLSNPT